MATEKTADVKFRHDEADREIAALRQVREGQKIQTAQTIRKIDVQYRYAGLLKRAAQGHG